MQTDTRYIFVASSLCVPAYVRVCGRRRRRRRRQHRRWLPNKQEIKMLYALPLQSLLLLVRCVCSSFVLLLLLLLFSFFSLTLWLLRLEVCIIFTCQCAFLA